eukprot:CFRG3880T1
MGKRGLNGHTLLCVYTKLYGVDSRSLVLDCSYIRLGACVACRYRNVCPQYKENQAVYIKHQCVIVPKRCSSEISEYVFCCGWEGELRQVFVALEAPNTCLRSSIMLHQIN